ncbi:unnamed protein product [Toxocara canis]|uniref:Uncharacterized protein n=1 Tax=Toxocara canis TaxID=6265 RepID=A0A183UP52_TOXCA|nr:unnamed protein product [Toxocara canis]
MLTNKVTLIIKRRGGACNTTVSWYSLSVGALRAAPDEAELRPAAAVIHLSTALTVFIRFFIDVLPLGFNEFLSLLSFSSMRASFTRRVSIAGGVVVGSSGSAPPQSHFGGVVSVQSAQNNFSATVARQQQHIMKHQEGGRQGQIAQQGDGAVVHGWSRVAFVDLVA